MYFVWFCVDQRSAECSAYAVQHLRRLQITRQPVTFFFSVYFSCLVQFILVKLLQHLVCLCLQMPEYAELYLIPVKTVYLLKSVPFKAGYCSFEIKIF